MPNLDEARDEVGRHPGENRKICFMLRLGIVAGEASGDYLAAKLVESLRQKVPDLLVEGIGGTQLQAAGCDILYPMERLAVMGLLEVAGRYFELRRVRNRLIAHFRKSPPDLFIGVDSPDFNLGLEKALHDHGIRTVHYVSPSVWAWRSYRIKNIKSSTDLMLVLFPFEQEFYRQWQMPVECVGHPLADEINPEQDTSAARDRLGLPADKKVIALMPGSRQTELEKMLPVMLETAYWCHRRHQDLVFISSVLSSGAVRYIEAMQDRLDRGRQFPGISVYQRQSRDVLAAADAAILTSGTVTLEALLYGLPMIVAYRMNDLSYRIIRSLVKVKFIALPNLLAGKKIVTEFLQNECTPLTMGPAILELLENESAVNRMREEFRSIHCTLGSGGGNCAADAVLRFLQKP